MRKLLVLGLLGAGSCAWAQSVSPVIVEYKAKAEGKTHW